MSTGTVDPIVRLVGVTKLFGDIRAVDDVSLDIAPGSVTCIVGPSGCGKSTLLRTINMMEHIDAGAIFVDGEMIGHQVRGRRRVEVSKAQARKQTLNFGMVFQQFNLFPHYTALENVTVAPTLVGGLSRDGARAVGRRALEQVGLSDRTDHYPNELSGGQQQRVAIARALAMEPKVLLFDEPTSALDPELVGEVLSVIRGLAATGATMLIVTHEMRFAEDVADEIIMMDAGRIIERGAPADVLHNPSTDRAKRFFAHSVGSRPDPNRTESLP
ncbi:amino acid ABC transporter ATP-binding protein [Microbacterium azadirachtae]|uniref:Polar amino acid transport system ATP-binding protein n=1 Tax=Microbacterium azadirachtae TaxID=582680 RepID=A0A1I6G5W0_9MICO|nr:amino acid ABC transporter ATP-binding protein [Microbacterium azadirachtae]SDL35105.1 amino acid ABC transporter ATP-binding protein, PAAT family [Microbacterium azadirachtae]SEF65750.1 amino acid ABC transporter ATP-binding protein, PAAT family [Microbacterium azadirachtae]SEF66554.1 amino acid ABC transporter ATP-binding protein, PAAT family [Microbacterium azadirachtae]SFR37569.1 polar amino acid transport system ATP-binding protein [Microbacterium azadirachtae]